VKLKPSDYLCYSDGKESTMLNVIVERKKSSFDCKFNKNLNSFENNIKNNTKDILKLYQGDELLFECAVQSVANHPSVTTDNSIRAGKFEIKLFVEKRAFWNNVHGICNTTTKNGIAINENSVNAGSPDRFLIHDKQKNKPALENTETRNAYSAGCLIIASVHMNMMNKILVNKGCKPGDVILGYVIEL